MEFILENYVIIIFVGLFFVFALIGYLIDNIKNTKKEEEKELPHVKSIVNNITDANLKKEEEVNLNNDDDLLKNYDESSID